MDNEQNKEGTTASEHSVTGVIIGVLIVALVIILAGLYMWSGLITKEQPVPVPPTTRTIPNKEPETPRAEADIQALDTVSSSDELNAIEADLDGTLLELDNELNQIEAELEADMQVQ